MSWLYNQSVDTHQEHIYLLFLKKNRIICVKINCPTGFALKKKWLEFKIFLLTHKALRGQAPLYLRELRVSFYPIETLTGGS